MQIEFSTSTPECCEVIFADEQRLIFLSAGRLSTCKYRRKKGSYLLRSFVCTQTKDGRGANKEIAGR
jgi:hypothetical protein